MDSDSEQIVFVNRFGEPKGQPGPKLKSHHSNTKLHLAFSCYIFRRKDGAFLVTQRALSKKVWPGVWTNSACGHPAPGESMEHAISRRAKAELGIDNLSHLRCLVPDYVYKTPPFRDVVEHEFCPIFAAVTADEPKRNPREVEDYIWVPWAQYVRMLSSEAGVMSWWSKDQYKRIERLIENFLQEQF